MNSLNLSKTSLYAIFHANLNFSLIDEREYKRVINTCYWPLLEIVQRNKKAKIGFECSGNTLQKIDKLDRKLIKTLKRLIDSEKIEFLASGMEQIIAPLVPFQITLDNLKYGQDIYKKILGIDPKIAYINEQTFSDGIIDLYKEVGYETVVLDWDSLPDESKKLNSPYRPAIIKTQTGSEIVGIFISSIAMQEFRKVVFSELSQDRYLSWLKDTIKKNHISSFPIYGDDLEIYDYKPNSLNFNLDKKSVSDFDLIEKLLKKLLESKFDLILPSELIQKNKESMPTSITNANQTVRTKKQEKYNATRWAVCGRGNSKINTSCSKIFKNLNNLKKDKERFNLLNKELISLWGSDFRTHTTEEKYLEFQARLGWLIRESEKPAEKRDTSFFGDEFNSEEFQKIDKIETNCVKVNFWTQKGGVIESLAFPQISPKPLCGTLHQGYYQTSKLQADWFTGHTIIRLKDNNTLTDLENTDVLGPKNPKDYPIKIPIYAKVKIGSGEIVKKYSIYVNEPRIDIEKYFMFYSLEPLSFRNFNLTLFPESFDQDSMYLATINGGKTPEKFSLNNSIINQDELVNLKISSHGCQGATEGWVAMGDKEKGIAVISDLAENYCVPLIHFEKVDDTFFGRISTSVAESDETASHFYRGKFKFKTSVVGFKNLSEII